MKIYERAQQTCNFVQNNLNTRACKFEQSARNSSSKFQTRKKQGWILGSKCWSYWPNASEARITVYASEDDKNYGDIFDHEGHLIRPVAAFRALLPALSPSRLTINAQHRAPGIPE